MCSSYMTLFRLLRITFPTRNDNGIQLELAFNSEQLKMHLNIWVQKKQAGSDKQTVTSYAQKKLNNQEYLY